MRETIHFEGIPGAGKTTAAEKMCDFLQDSGVDACWWREESAAHPIMPIERRALSHSSAFPQMCLEAWQAFLKASNRTAVLDGYAFQSTVRFLYANRIEQPKIEGYFNQWQQMSPNTVMVFLIVDDPDAHYDEVVAERGEDWSLKLYDYVERTPIGIAQGLIGKEGFVEFWSRYQQLCIQLLDTARVPVELVSSRSWCDTDLAGLATRHGLLR